MNIGTKQIMEKAKSMLDSHRRNKELFAPILQDTQAEYNHQPEEASIQISQGLDVPLSQVYSVATLR